MSSLPSRKGSQVPTKSVRDDNVPSFMDSEQFRSRIEAFDFHPLPWQALFHHDAFAMRDDGAPFYRNIGVSVPRQNGKSEAVAVFMVLKTILFGHSGAYTSYEKESAHTIFSRIIDHIEATPALKLYFPVLPPKTTRNILSPIVARHPKTGEKLAHMEFHTRKGGTGRGKGLQYVVFDEANLLTRAEYNSLGPTIAARINGQLIFLGTPSTMESSSTFGMKAGASDGGHFFIELRRKILTGSMKHSAWLEWGVSELTDKDDKEAWYASNPSLGYVFGDGKGLTEQDFESYIGELEDFNVERLGYWTPQSKERVIDITRWKKLKVSNPAEAISDKSYVSLAVKSSYSEESVYVAVAVRRSDDKIFIEVIEHFKTNVSWTNELFNLMYPFLRNNNCTSIYVDGELARTAVVQKLSEARAWNVNGSPYRQGKVIMTGAKDMSSACSSLLINIKEKSVVHGGQYNLSLAVEDAKKREFRGNSDSFAFESMSGMVDITPLEAVALAVGGVLKHSKSDVRNNVSDPVDISVERYAGFGVPETSVKKDRFGAFR